jgi:predicted ATP-grasp superfamily ATP-dependent carboligase
LSTDGRFHYGGGRLPLSPELNERATRLARRALETVSGWRGYVGVDLVVGEATDGGQDWVIEINPRLTTSYIGLRVLAKSNLAEAMLRIAIGEPVRPLNWREGRVQFTSDGQVLPGVSPLS